MSIATRLLAGKTAAITGGTTGIGRAITLEYLRQGANVAVNHLGLPKDEPLRQSLIEEAKRIRSEAPKDAPTGELLEIAGDVTDPETGKALVAEAAKKWGSLDVFIANAGIFKACKFLDIEKETFDNSLRVNVNGAFYAFQSAARQMVKQGKGGSIIGISSISALVGGGLQDKIRVNALLPGTIHTQLADHDMANEEKRKYLEHRIPWGRVGRPEDLAGPAVFLGSEKLSGFVTGAQLLVDGGIDISCAFLSWVKTRNRAATAEADSRAGKVFERQLGASHVGGDTSNATRLDLAVAGASARPSTACMPPVDQYVGNLRDKHLE
ncbi:hypothetical protein Daus18300_011454 [Diaporthe australafricana]|uniref:Uncharacterized protein n=1 Tax=Diaporthe australafricana TaxID=127596 RepID=A0ABR3W6F1_9PEZI